MSETGFSTIAIHGGEELAASHQAVTAPIFQTSTFVIDGNKPYSEIRYTRMNNTPNHLALHEKLAQLEGGEAALTFGSGMAAISAALFSVLGEGGHVLTQNCIYGGTFGLLSGEMKRFGFSYTLFDGMNPKSWKSLLRPETRAIYVEAMANPLLSVVELEEVVSFARENGLVSIIDNTFASPYNFQPLKMGFDLSVHSATKYLNGHADVIAGCVIGSAARVDAMKSLVVHLGATLDPFACFLLDRGIKTLPLRMQRHNENAQEIARFLEGHERVKAVHYPGLESHPNHVKAKQWFRGFGGVLSFELHGGSTEVENFLQQLSSIRCAPSLGGVESLVVVPATSTHAGQSEEERQALGISPQLIRLAIGIEDCADLLAELERALKVL